MTDTRCANPEDQLDVDIMIIEHTIYYAIDAKLKALKSDFSGDADDTANENASRLIENFDILIRLFHQNHPTTSGATTLSEGTIFNIKILEFLILFDQWICRTPCGPHLTRERSLNTIFRRKWLTAWAIVKEGPGRDIRPYIYNASISERLSQGDPISLEDMMVRFMDLSAEIAEAMGCVSENWYRLAAEFMLQCAVERVQNLIDTNTLHGPGGVSYVKGVAAWLSECFAWGIIWPFSHEIKLEDEEDQQQIKQRIREETFIRDVFRAKPDPPTTTTRQTSDADADTHVTEDDRHDATRVKEDARWTNQRTKYHSEIFSLAKSCTNAPDCTCGRGLHDIRARHPLDVFLHDLRAFVEGCWCLNVKNISGKPTLVQIEEGAIPGLDDREFARFLDRVGLSVAARGGGHVVRWSN